MVQETHFSSPHNSENAPSKIVLNNAYLVNEILGNIWWASWWVDKGWLARVARTCQAFRKPALKRVWVSLPTIIPFLNVLPNFRFRFGGPDGTGKIYYLDGPISSDSMQNMMVYASFVRKLVYRDRWNKKKMYCLEDSVYFALVEMTPPERSLLLNLSSLFLVFGSMSDDPSILRLISSPHLQCITFSLAPDSSDPFHGIDDLRLFMQRYVNSPDMTKVLIHTPLNMDVIQIIQSYKNLNELAVAKPSILIPASVIGHWATLEAIESISLEVPSLDWSASLGPCCFEKLLRLDIACSVDDVVQIFASASFPSLSEFRLRVVLPAAPELQDYPWKRLFDDIGKATTLKILKIEYYEEFSNSASRNRTFGCSYPGIEFETVEESLLNLEIQQLEQCLPILRSLSPDNVLRKICTAWPSASRLKLGTTTRDIPTLKKSFF